MKQSGNQPINVKVLSISPSREDHTWLRRAFSKSAWTQYSLSKWSLSACHTLESAVATLKNNHVPIVLCEAELNQGTWRDMLDQSRKLSNPPLLIVTSRLADEHLWAEALNLGAYDVLAKPFDEHEVVRILSLAWLHWNDRSKISVQPARAMCAAS
jgi:DNA-binding response OmpR family regulator